MLPSLLGCQYLRLKSYVIQSTMNLQNGYRPRGGTRIIDVFHHASGNGCNRSNNIALTGQHVAHISTIGHPRRKNIGCAELQ